MTQRERDRLVVLKKAQKKLITQKQAGIDLGLSERHIRWMLARLKEVGDKALVHGLRGRPSNRQLSEEIREKAVRILSEEVYRGFGPTLPASIWPRNTKSRLGAKLCGSS